MSPAAEPAAPPRHRAGEEAGVRERVHRLDRLLGELETLPTAPARARALETVEALVELYGEGLARMVAAARESSDPGVIAAFADDPLVGHLLLVHDLHPLGLERRVALALEAVGTHLGGSGARLVGVEGGVARIHLDHSVAGCGGAGDTRQLVEDAVYELAPELDGVVVEEPTSAQPVSLGPTRRRRPSLEDA